MSNLSLGVVIKSCKSDFSNADTLIRVAISVTEYLLPNRIVSINKSYVRPIVRGKEVKSVEFGAKVNNIFVDRISFIEKLLFNPFSEGKRLIHCLKMHKRLFGVDTKKAGGDTGYAGTENRDYCKENGTQKEHYDLRRVKARTKQTEILRIYFVIHTSNVVQLADRIEQRAKLALARRESVHTKCTFMGQLCPSHRERTKNPAERTG